MTNLIIDPTRGLVSLGPDGKEYAIPAPAGFSATHCVLMVEAGSQGNNGHDVRSAFLLEEGYEGLVTGAENIYDLVSETSNPFYHYAMPIHVFERVHVLNSSAASELAGVFEIKDIENPEFDSSWNQATNTVMYFYPDVLVTDRHTLKINQDTGTLRILAKIGIGANVVSIDDPRIISDDDASKVEVIVRHARDNAINADGVISVARYESAYGTGHVTDVINFHGHAVYAVDLNDASNGGMFNVFYPSDVTLKEIPHPKELPSDGETIENHSFKFFKSPDNARLFILSVADTTVGIMQDTSTYIVIHEVDFGNKMGGEGVPMLREIYCENMGTFLGKLQPRTYSDESPVAQLDYHEFGILAIGYDETVHMRILEIVGDSDEITISNFSASEDMYEEVIQSNATVVVSTNHQLN